MEALKPQYHSTVIAQYSTARHSTAPRSAFPTALKPQYHSTASLNIIAQHTWIKDDEDEDDDDNDGHDNDDHDSDNDGDDETATAILP